MSKNILDYGARSGGTELCTAAIQAALDNASLTGERVVIPAGIFLTGTIDLKGASLRLESGAILRGSTSMDHYPKQPFEHNELGPVQALIVCMEGEDITIDGDGTIDLNGSSFFDFSKPIMPESKVAFSVEQRDEATVHYDNRPNQCIFMANINGLKIKGITILDAPSWGITIHNCHSVRIQGLRIDHDLNVPNSDGIHVCSSNGVTIANCHISSGDDCIALSGITDWSTPCENILITNCILRSCSKAIVIGYIHSHVRNVIINNVIIHESNRGLCIMSNPGTGLVEDVRATNMIIDTKIRSGNWWGNGEPIFLIATEHSGHIPLDQKPDRDSRVNIRNIFFDGVSCSGENAIGIIGSNDNIENVHMQNIDYVCKDSENIELKGREFDMSPGRMHLVVPDNCALYTEEVVGLTLDNISTKNQNNEEMEIIT